MTTIREIRQLCDDADKEVTLPVGVVRELLDLRHRSLRLLIDIDIEIGRNLDYLRPAVLKLINDLQTGDAADDWEVGE